MRTTRNTGKKAKKAVLFGLELETAYNTKCGGNIDSGEYHNPLKFTRKFWNAERDSSLSCPRDNWGTVELTTNIFSRKQLKNVIEELKQEVRERVGFDNAEFSDYFEINHSMGHHIHFSIPQRRMLPKVYGKLFLKIRSTFFKKLEKYNEEIATKIKAQYFRSYAKRFNEKLARINRSYEFNLTNETRGLEWRSFNICGVKTWKQYEEVLIIALDTLEGCITEYFSGKTITTRRIDITNLVFGENKNESKSEIQIEILVKSKEEIVQEIEIERPQTVEVV